MAAQTGLDFEGEFNNAIDGLYKNNTTRDISPTDLRALPTAIRESYLNRLDDVIDEDSMASDSPTKVPTQQSVKAYVDAAGLGIVNSWKSPTLVATTANVTLSGEQTIDGVLTSASRILVKNQTSQPENGIYVTAAGAWSRSTDADIALELEGAAVTVQQGTTNANTSWLQTTDGITLGSSNIVWSQIGTSVPDADASTKGIAKLYQVTGTNTDGAMSQDAATDAFQPIDADLTAIAGLSPSNDDVLQRKAGAWTNRTLVQLMTDLGITVGIASTNTTGTAIAFAVPQIYGLPASPETGNITLVTTGLQKGMVQVLYHNDASEPSYPAEFVKIGGEDYEGSTLNIYYMHALSTTRIEYTISHEI